jgi:hypothetical protein
MQLVPKYADDTEATSPATTDKESK